MLGLGDRERLPFFRMRSMNSGMTLPREHMTLP